MERIELNLLKAEFNAQIKEIEKIFADIDDRKRGAKKNKAKLESLAYKLHNLYCAFEDLFKIIARHFENQVEDIAKYHKELLKRMTLSIEGVRPRLLSEASFNILDELRAFRHYFRHAYQHELRHEKIKPVLDASEKIKILYKDEIRKFLNEIEDGINAADSAD